MSSITKTEQNIGKPQNYDRIKNVLKYMYKFALFLLYISNSTNTFC